MADASLVQAMVAFHTNDEDKDDDTHVTVTVRQSDGTIAARIDDDFGHFFGHFNDHSNNGPFDLMILNPGNKSDLRTGNVTLQVDPNGNDTWRFNFSVDLLFSDGSHLNTEADGLELSQDRQGRLSFLDIRHDRLRSRTAEYPSACIGIAPTTGLMVDSCRADRAATDNYVIDEFDCRFARDLALRKSKAAE